MPQMFYSAAHQCGMSCPSILILSMFSVCCSAHRELINCSYLKLLSCHFIMQVDNMLAISLKTNQNDMSLHVSRKKKEHIQSCMGEWLRKLSRLY